MRKVFGFAVVGVFLFSAASAVAKRRSHLQHARCAGSPIVAIHVLNDAAMPPTALQATEAALLVQANTQLCVAWNTPRIVFRDYGWQMTLEPVDWVGWSGGVGGFHGAQAIPADYPCAAGEIDAHCVPDLWVQPNSKFMSHELMETLVDQSETRVFGGWLAEVSDPVNALSYTLGGVRVADFVYPAWFRCHASGPWDFLHRTFAPLDVEGGNEIWVNPDGTLTGTVPNNYGC